MPSFVTIADPDAGPGATGRIRIDHRSQPASSSPTLVLLGGMTQTVASWSGQLRPLSSAGRDVLAYEARGQGATELALTDCSPARHVADFVAMVAAAGLRPPVDLVGFSFGGRIALAIAATHPDLVRKLVVCGVALDRGTVGRLITAAWISSLRTGDLETLARVSLPDILGAPYLDKHAEHIDGMIKTTIQRNRYAGIKALFEQTLALSPDSPWHPRATAPRVSCPTLVLGGDLDRVAPPSEVAALADLLHARHVRVPGSGHTVPIEDPAAFREALESFLT